jgi:hypothetical protein
MYTISKTIDDNADYYLIKDNDKNTTIGSIKNPALAEAITSVLNASAKNQNQKKERIYKNGQ